MIFAFAYAYTLTAASLTVFRKQGLLCHCTRWFLKVTVDLINIPHAEPPHIILLLLMACSNNPSFLFTHCQTTTFWPQKKFLFCCHLYVSDNCCGNFSWDAFLLCSRDSDDHQVISLKTYCSLIRLIGLLSFSESQTDVQSVKVIFHPAISVSGASSRSHFSADGSENWKMTGLFALKSTHSVWAIAHSDHD